MNRTYDIDNCLDDARQERMYFAEVMDTSLESRVDSRGVLEVLDEPLPVAGNGWANVTIAATGQTRSGSVRAPVNPKLRPLNRTA